MGGTAVQPPGRGAGASLNDRCFSLWCYSSRVVPTLTTVVSLPCCCCDLYTCRKESFSSVGVATVVHTHCLLHSDPPACSDMLGLDCLLQVPCCASFVWHAGAKRGCPPTQVPTALALTPFAVFCHSWCALCASHSPTPCPCSSCQLSSFSSNTKNKKVLEESINTICLLSAMSLWPCAAWSLGPCLSVMFACLLCML